MQCGNQMGRSIKLTDSYEIVTSILFVLQYGNFIWFHLIEWMQSNLWLEDWFGLRWAIGNGDKWKDLIDIQKVKTNDP